MKWKPQAVILSSTLFVLIGIAVTVATGLWQTESDKVPRKLQAEVVTAESPTQYDPADIRGSYTFGEVSELFNIPLDALTVAFGIPQSNAEGFQVKSLESLYPNAEAEIGTASVRLFVAWYLQVPYEPAETTYLPATASDALRSVGALSQTQLDYLTRHTVSLP